MQDNHGMTTTAMKETKKVGGINDTNTSIQGIVWPCGIHGLDMMHNKSGLRRKDRCCHTQWSYHRRGLVLVSRSQSSS
eukprot:2899726-Ditylum_brightwellii.AAC.1